MTVDFFGSNRNVDVELNTGKTVTAVFEKLDIPVETYLVEKGGIIITEFEELSDNDKITFIRVASGG